MHMQISSINLFTGHHFQQLFSGENKTGLITTSGNSRTYHVTWDSETDTIAVKRDLTNASVWTRISEVLERWSQFDTTSNAIKWKNRLNVQKLNLKLAEPLETAIKQLITEIEDINSSVEPSRYPNRTIQNHFDQLCMPLIRLLDSKRQHLEEQAKQLAVAVEEGFLTSQHWTQEQDVQSTVNRLQHQARQLTLFIKGIKNFITPYCTALGAIDVSKTPLIYDAVFTRLSKVGIRMRLMLDTYFENGGNIPKAEIQGYNAMLTREAKITAELNNRQLATHFTYNELLTPPSYTKPDGKDAQKQGHINCNYRMCITDFTNVLVDPDKTFDDIQNAAEELSMARNRWREQISLEEEIEHLIDQLKSPQNNVRTQFPILIKQLDKLQELQQLLSNNGELLSLTSFELLQSQYKHLQRANTLYIEIGQFLKELPGLVGLWKKSNYDEEMQSRILHLTVLRNMCQEEESLTQQSLDHMEDFVTVHKNTIQAWADSSKFSRFKLYDPIQSNLDYPAWLVKENQLFLKNCQEASKLLWEAKYQALRNEELLKARGEMLKKVEGKTEVLVQSSQDLREITEQLHREHSIGARMMHFFGFSK